MIAATLALGVVVAILPGELPTPAPNPGAITSTATTAESGAEGTTEAGTASPGVNSGTGGTGGAGPSPEAWAALRRCESGGNYQINTGNGYFGAYQFDLTTWRGVGGRGYPHEATPAEQDRRALILWRLRGADPWPICGQYLEG